MASTSRPTSCRVTAGSPTRRHVAEVWGVDPDELPGPGLSAYEMLDRLGTDGGVRVLLVLASNIAVSAPNANHITDRCARWTSWRSATSSRSETAELADVVLPSAQWAEEDGTMTNLEGRVIRRRMALPPPDGVKDDLQTIAGLADRLGHGSAFPDDPEKVFEELRAASRGGIADYSGISYQRIDAEQGVFWPCAEGEAGDAAAVHPGVPDAGMAGPFRQGRLPRAGRAAGPRRGRRRRGRRSHRHFPSRGVAMNTTPVFLQGIFPFTGTGLEKPAAIDPGLRYEVPLGVTAQALYFRGGRVELKGGRVIDCDMVVLAAGVRPNSELAVTSGFTVERAIVVDDQMRTVDDEDMYAGECAQHRGQVYGLVARSGSGSRSASGWAAVTTAPPRLGEHRPGSRSARDQPSPSGAGVSGPFSATARSPAPPFSRPPRT